jgi:hypothetical protein
MNGTTPRKFEEPVMESEKPFLTRSALAIQEQLTVALQGTP